MTVESIGELRAIIRDLPDDAPVDIIYGPTGSIGWAEYTVEYADWANCDGLIIRTEE